VDAALPRQHGENLLLLALKSLGEALIRRLIVAHWPMQPLDALVRARLPHRLRPMLGQFIIGHQGDERRRPSVLESGQ
jgi:hypothetical protein